uniref:methyl-accepting chemotaxis protein n=1 Tax=Pantoea sp. IMH TaxID=1267600 RepID=UPI00046936B0|nr:methyl-accepting chemotaxis protein [Pantoea sp. IMH]
MKLNNMSVGMRMGTGFALLLLMSVIMGSCAFWLTMSSEKKVDELISWHLKKERMIEDWTRLLNANSGLAMTAMNASDPALRNSLQQTLTTSAAEIAHIQEQLTPLLRLPTGQRLLANVTKAREKYTLLRHEGFQMAESGQFEKTIPFILNRFYPATQDYTHALTDLRDFQKELIDNNYSLILSDAQRSEIIILTFIIASIILGIFIAWYITCSITRPLAEAVMVASKVSAGDLTVDVHVRSKDQLGMMMQSLKEMVAGLASTVADVKNSAVTISHAANEIDAGNQDLASRTEEQAASVEETAATLEQLTSTIKRSADNSHNVNQLFAETGEVIRQNGERMNDVLLSMQDIHNASAKMTDIVTAIEGIAFQTNILALNAAVEAARAGEQGRGFAVVAGEVRTLAQRSSSSAREIREIISSSLSKIKSCRVLVDEADQGMKGIVDNVSGVQQLVDEIARASAEQSDGITQINIAMGQIDTTTQQNAALVEESSAASASLNDQARLLLNSVQVFTCNEADMSTCNSTSKSENNRPEPVVSHNAGVLASTNWVKF